jgi:hypothetical protein
MEDILVLMMVRKCSVAILEFAVDERGVAGNAVGGGGRGGGRDRGH